MSTFSHFWHNPLNCEIWHYRLLPGHYCSIIWWADAQSPPWPSFSIFAGKGVMIHRNIISWGVSIWISRLLLWYLGKKTKYELCFCSTGQRCHCSQKAHKKLNRYAVRSPRWFGGAYPVLLFRMCCASMAHRRRTCGVYGAWMAMPQRMAWRIRNWILRIHSASGVYIPCMCGDQLDSTTYGGHMYSAWDAYMPNL